MSRPLGVPAPLARAGSTVRRALHVARRPKPPGRQLYRVIFEYAQACPTASFIQVGANDGEGEDPLRESIDQRHWTGIMVEPVPYVFERLKRKYGHNPRVSLENAAIADHDGVQEMYFLEEAAPGETVPAWYDKLGSLRRDVILKHVEAIPDIEDRLTARLVPCLTFDSLCRKHGVSRVDVIQIDTEGYDFDVIKLADLRQLRPKLVMFENYHMDPETHEACLAHMRGHGYQHLSDGMDTICLKAGNGGPGDRKIDRFWAEMRTGYVPDSYGPGFPAPND